MVRDKARTTRLNWCAILCRSIAIGPLKRLAPTALLSVLSFVICFLPVHLVFVNRSHAVLSLEYLDGLGERLGRGVAAADVVLGVDPVRLYVSADVLQ